MVETVTTKIIHHKLFSIDTGKPISAGKNKSWAEGPIIKFHGCFLTFYLFTIASLTGLATIGLIGATLTSLYLGLTLTEDELVDETLVYGDAPSGMHNDPSSFSLLFTKAVCLQPTKGPCYSLVIINSI